VALNVLFCRKYTIINIQSAQVKWLLVILYSFLEQRWETHYPQLFLYAFSKFRKATVSFFISVCLPVCLYTCLSVVRPSAWYNSTPTGWILKKFGICLSEDIQQSCLTVTINGMQEIHPVIFLLFKFCHKWLMFGSSKMRFLNHTQGRTTVGRIPLGEWSASRRDLYLTTHNTHNRHLCLRWDSNPRSQQASGRRPTS
jgi:hypothetical protein